MKTVVENVYPEVELDAIDKFDLTAFNEMTSVDLAIENESLIIHPKYLAVVKVEKEDGEVYYSIVFVTDDNKYYTGSNTVMSIMGSLIEQFDTLPKLKFSRMPSKKREGKYYISVRPVR